MKHIFVYLLLLAASVSMSAQNWSESYPEYQPGTTLRPSKTVLLYPEGQAAGKGITENGIQITEGPGEDNGLKGEETCSKSGNRGNIGDYARMDLYFPEKCNGQMLVVCPGGGYSFVSSFNEGTYVAEWLLARGNAV